MSDWTSSDEDEVAPPPAVGVVALGRGRGLPPSGSPTDDGRGPPGQDWSGLGRGRGGPWRGGDCRGRRQDDDRGRRDGAVAGRGYHHREEGRGRGGGGRHQDDDDDGGSCFRGRRRDDDCSRRGQGDDRRSRRVADENGGDGDDRGPPEEHLDWDGNVKRKPVTYIPPQPTDDPEELFNSGIRSGVNFSKYDRITVRVSGRGAPSPVTAFENAGLGSLLLRNVRRSGYTNLTPVQKYSLPAVMEGRDLMACAQTGSGKTAGFLLPILERLTAEAGIRDAGGRRRSDPLAVVVSPTRELAIQIFNEARKFAHESDVQVRLAYGGAAVRYQADLIRDGCDILVATPGRLIDFVNRGLVGFSAVLYVILDEADRLLDLGFLPNVEEMLGHPTMPPKGRRQTLMYSATFPDEVQRLAHRFLHDFIFLAVGPVGGANADVSQTILEVSGDWRKREALVEVLGREGESGKTLVFVETKKRADLLAGYLSLKSFPATSIHGDREQREREQALRDFTKGAMQVLVATAVAARGLDIRGVTHVVNYDMPDCVDEYVHRIGRTGRVGNVGRATSFFDAERNRDLAPGLARILRDADQEVPTFLNEHGSYVSDLAQGRSDIRGMGITTHVLEVEDEGW